MHHLSSSLDLSSGADRLQDALGLPTHRKGLPTSLCLLEQGPDYGQGPQLTPKPTHLPHPAPDLPEAPFQGIGSPNPLPVGKREAVVGPAGLQVPLQTFHRRGELSPLGPLKQGQGLLLCAKVGAYKTAAPHR